MRLPDAADYVRTNFASEGWSVEINSLDNLSFQVVLPENVRGLTEALMEIYSDTGFLTDFVNADACSLVFWKDDQWQSNQIKPQPRIGVCSALIAGIAILIALLFLCSPPLMSNITEVPV